MNSCSTSSSMLYLHLTQPWMFNSWTLARNSSLLTCSR
jgi:hypothetical protein